LGLAVSGVFCVNRAHLGTSLAVLSGFWGGVQEKQKARELRAFFVVSCRLWFFVGAILPSFVVVGYA
jgi:hypothetical protein